MSKNKVISKIPLVLVPANIFLVPANTFLVPVNIFFLQKSTAVGPEKTG